ncbi:MAG: cadherin-like domain-containing protein [Saprospirales bacterium]|nr:cadherin-like domain-containing protein [Saprospirales bacterium]
MNISRLGLKLVPYFLWGLATLFVGSSSAQAQGDLEYLSFDVLIGDTLSYSFYSQPPYLPEIDQYGTYPSYGTADLPGPGHLGVPGNNTLTYIPTVSYPVVDTIYLQYWRFTNGIYRNVTVVIEVNVVPSIVTAVDDFAETNENSPVTIDVLFNDFWTGGSLNIADVVLVNNGSFTLNADSTEVIFTPASGFNGIAHFNYTICDNMGVCDMATVSIAVMASNNPVVDTVYVIARKNVPRELLFALDGYSLVSGPSHGTIDFTSEDYPIYKPATGYSGPDKIVFEKTENGTTFQKVVMVDVLNITKPNVFVFDDFTSTIADQSIEINALANDLGGFYLVGVAVVTQPAHGTVVNLGGGIFEYTPHPGYTEGVDHFVYRAYKPNYSALEYGDVYVTVSNFVPAQSTFNLSTPQNVPLVLSYNIPVTEYDLTITVEPDHGTIQYYPGNQTVTLYGQTIEGFNLLIYIPDSNTVNLTDDFEFEYCTATSQNCPNKVVKIYVDLLDITVAPNQFCVGDNCVWAGDTNSDGVVNMEDILPLGLCMGDVGLARPNPDLSQWFGQYGDNWNNIFFDFPVDQKHVDADGNGIVGGADTVAISNFYLEQHSFIPQPPPPALDVPLYFFEQSITPVEEGDLVVLEIWLGNPNEELAVDMYGFTFGMTYETDLVIPESVHINFLPESWMSYNSPVLNLVKKPFDGRIDAGLTRTSGFSDTGYGIVATLDFVIVEDIEGIRLKDDFIDLKLENIRAMNSAGKVVSLPDNAIRIPLRKDSGLATQENPLVVFPNPANQYAQVHLNGKENLIQDIRLLTIAGSQVAEYRNLDLKDFVIPVYNLTPGSYFVQVRAQSGELFTQKLQVVR